MTKQWVVLHRTQTHPLAPLWFWNTLLLIYALHSEVGLNGLNCCAECAEVLRRVVDGRLIGDQQIKTLFGAVFGQLVADAGRAPVTIASRRVSEVIVQPSQNRRSSRTD